MEENNFNKFLSPKPDRGYYKSPHSQLGTAPYRCIPDQPTFSRRGVPFMPLRKGFLIKEGKKAEGWQWEAVIKKEQSLSPDITNMGFTYHK